jgi:hypothetical protein
MAKSRSAKFRYEHPYLFEYLMSATFHVLTLEFPTLGRELTATDYNEDRDKVADYFRSLGWTTFYIFVGFTRSLDRTQFRVLLDADKVPAWPRLNATWTAFAGPSATIKAKKFDGADGDLQLEGLRFALSGIVDYWMSLHNNQVGAVALSERFAGLRLQMSYGDFRGFEARIHEERASKYAKERPVAADICEDESEHMPSVHCGQCGSELADASQEPLTTFHELTKEGGTIIFSRSTKPIYRKSSCDWGNPTLQAPMNLTHVGGIPPAD